VQNNQSDKLISLQKFIEATSHRVKETELQSVDT
jgi:hypothetical protein